MAATLPLPFSLNDTQRKKFFVKLHPKKKKKVTIVTITFFAELHQKKK
jgi:hypothetical protein